MTDKAEALARVIALAVPGGLWLNKEREIASNLRAIWPHLSVPAEPDAKPQDEHDIVLDGPPPLAEEPPRARWWDSSCKCELPPADGEEAVDGNGCPMCRRCGYKLGGSPAVKATAEEAPEPGGAEDPEIDADLFRQYTALYGELLYLFGLHGDMPDAGGELLRRVRELVESEAARQREGEPVAPPEGEQPWLKRLIRLIRQEVDLLADDIVGEVRAAARSAPAAPAPAAPSDDWKRAALQARDDLKGLELEWGGTLGVKLAEWSSPANTIRWIDKLEAGGGSEAPAPAAEGAEPEAADPERVAQLIAHRACCGTEHNPEAGKLHGCCVVCGVPWPCAFAGTPPVAPPPADRELRKAALAAVESVQGSFVEDPGCVSVKNEAMCRLRAALDRSPAAPDEELQRLMAAMRPWRKAWRVAEERWQQQGDSPPSDEPLVGRTLRAAEWREVAAAYDALVVKLNNNNPAAPAAKEGE